MDAYTSGIIEFDITHKVSVAVTLAEMMPLLKENSKLFWIHCDLNDKDFLSTLNTQLSLPESLNRFIQNANPITQMEESDESVTLKVQVPLDLTNDKKKPPTYTPLTIHLTHHYCITFSAGSIPALNEFKQQYNKSLRYAKTPSFIMFVVFDNILNEYAKLIFGFENQSDDLDSISHSGHKNHYRIINRIKKSVIQCKRNISVIRDTLMRISGKKIEVISELCRKSLIDLYNHSQALTAEADSEREILKGMLDQIDNSIMHRISDTMKVLTAYATIFMPPTLITGIYGMNFHWIPELSWEYGYFYALSLILGSGLTLYLVFKRLKWF